MIQMTECPNCGGNLILVACLTETSELVQCQKCFFLFELRLTKSGIGYLRRSESLKELEEELRV